MTQCWNCKRTIVGEHGSRLCSDCRRMYRRGWEDGSTAPVRHAVYATTAEGMEGYLCDDDTLAGLTAPQVAALVDQIATEQRWCDGDEDVTA